MLVPEEQSVLRYLRTHYLCNFSQLLEACLPGTPPSDGQRLLSNLEWLGYIAIFPDSQGQPLMIQLTNREQEMINEE